MKTPMQELIEFIDKEQGMFKDVVVMEIKRKALSLLPTEKQAIIDAHFQGMVDSPPDNYIGKEKTGEQYFNEKYNENS